MKLPLPPEKMMEEEEEEAGVAADGEVNEPAGERGVVSILPVDSAKAEVCTFFLCSNTVGGAIEGANKAEVTSCSCVVNRVMVKEAAAFAREAARKAEAALGFFFILEDLSNSIEEEEEVVEGEGEGEEEEEEEEEDEDMSEEEEEWKELEEEEREKKKKRRRRRRKGGKITCGISLKLKWRE
ncbi:uncharacterized protein MONOS_12591 [Monocercomonoides exilis]|uniref:uncharacterized protein n=1 Tax=Monocercomonoides exilis TaxID=2049356 RepID=UPI00355A5C02|nr:hypothetical protein MONOS_12591 [Monocercomonoides exilis]|eukprot:MONOS_12591.1-p1 / transcript=MONOS_12591.1 / gene=MONOS_12591 / organism=Monocercomonoides_exilis_PA203 / gene_product=unspecified product / transcript_product=unspecified product / location=Mono_scaffold00706:18222-18770(-) / protein_length=183 / sequence_SO=supercontig / SO=protein_coding / is_pseudo=false